MRFTFLHCRKNGERTIARVYSRAALIRVRVSHLEEQGTGFQPVASVCFLKFVLVTNGSFKYVWPSTTVVTTNHVSPFRSFDRSSNSLTAAFSLYGAPFFRRYPGRN